MFKKTMTVLILVTFLITLSPINAFAGAASFSASKARVNISSVEANGASMMKFTIYLLDKNNNVAADQKVYIGSNRGKTDVLYAADGTTKLTETSQVNVFETPVSTNGKIEFKIKSSTAGTAKIGIGLINPTNTANSIYQYLIDNNKADAASVGLVDTIEVKFRNSSAKEIVLFGDPEPSKGSISGSGTEASPFLADTGGVAPQVQGNGCDYFEITFQVKGDNNSYLCNEEISFTSSYPQISFNEETAVTDNGGMATVKVFANEPGTYKINAEALGKKKEVYLLFASNDPAKIELSSMMTIDPLIATDIDRASDFQFKLFDGAGNLVFPDKLKIQDVLEFEWEEPEDSNLDENWAFDDLSSGKLKQYSMGKKHMYYTSSGYIWVMLPEIQIEGKYVLKVKLKNTGIELQLPFEAKKQGEIERVTLKYYNKSLPLDSRSLTPIMYRYDAQDVCAKIDSGLFGSEVIFGVDNYELLDPDNNTPNSIKGVICTRDKDEKEYTGKLTVSVIDTLNNKMATFDINITDTLEDIKVADLDANIPINKKTAGKIKFLDAKGQETFPGDLNSKNFSFSYVVLNKPEGAKFYIKEESNMRKTMEEKGYGKLNEVYCDTPGEVTFLVELKFEKYDNDKNKESMTFTKVKTVRFVTQIKYGTEKFVMFINSKSYFADGQPKVCDAAPIEIDKKAYVPLSVVADELEARLNWDESSQTVTLAREDRTIIFTIGDNLVKVSNGPAFMADGVPMIIDGVTYVPYRVIGEALGAKVNTTYDENDNLVAIEFSQEESTSTGMMGR